MRKRDQARDPDEPERRRTDDVPLRSDVVETMLGLQRSAGNQAVSALVARSPVEAEKQSEKAEGARATLADIGTIPLLSFSLPTSGPGGDGGSRGRGGGSRGREDKAPTVRELVVTSRVGKHTPDLFKAASDGKPMEVEIIIPGKPATRLKLTGAIISSYQTTGGGQPDEIETWTLNFQALEHTVEREEGANP